MVAHTRPEDDEVRKSGGGWKENPKIRKPSEDLLRTVYIVSCGLDFESTRRGKQRNGQGAVLQMNQKWLQNYLKKKAPHRNPQWIRVPDAQNTEESKDATNTFFKTLEWRLNGKNKKAYHSFWRHDPEDTVLGAGQLEEWRMDHIQEVEKLELKASSMMRSFTRGSKPSGSKSEIL